MKKKNLKKIPKFKNEDEERKFWATHDTTEYFDVSKAIPVVFPNLKPTTVMTSLRMPMWLLENIKGIANKRDIPVQSLMKMYLAEKVKEEYQTSKP